MKIYFKYLVIPAIAYFFISSAVYAKDVVDIEISGNSYVPTGEIKKVLSIKVGEEYNPVKTADDISEIYNLNKFDDVSVFLEDISSDTVKVIYKVEERPIIDDIEFKGNLEIKSKKLQKKIELEKGVFFDDFKMRQDAKSVEDYYKEKGYAECKVETYVNNNAGDKKHVIITFFVKEGKRIEIEEIVLDGVVQEKKKKVLKQFKSKRGKNYNSDTVKEDIENVKKYYKNRGFLNADIAEPEVVYNAERDKVKLLIKVEEGKKYYIDEVSFEGNSKYSKEELLKSLEMKKGDVYSEDKVRMDMMSIQEKYGTDGYVKMNIIPRFNYDDDNKQIDIAYKLIEGPKVYVRNIYIDGNYITRDYVIRREFDIEEGGTFNIDKVRKTQAELYQLGFFKDVRVEMLPTGEPDKTDIVFIVEEQKTGMASVGAGYSSVDKLVGTVRISWDNLFGRGQKLSLMWEFGTGDTKKQNYRLDFTEPYLFNTKTPFSFSIYNTIRRRYVNDYGYNERRRGGSISLGRHFTDDLSLFMKYALEDIKIYDINVNIADELSESRDMTSSVTPSLVYDTRDYPFDPSKGMLIRVSNQIAGGPFGGDRDFNKIETKSAYFQPVIWKLVGVFNVVTGAVTTFSDTEKVPIYEKFNVGGAESLRGYDYWEIGPREGGNYKFVVNAELKFPIVMEKKQTILQGAFFYDIGSSWKYFNDINFDSGIGSKKLKRGYGFGVRFKTPAFPIRLDWGYGIDKRPKESQWYFTLGDIF